MEWNDWGASVAGKIVNLMYTIPKHKIKQYTPQIALNVTNFFQKADLAIGDITITYEREQAVDFTMPWMNLGKHIYL